MKKTNKKIKWIVIRTKMWMSKPHKNMDGHSCRDVYDENPYKNNIDSHSYKDVHDENLKEYGQSFVQIFFMTKI